MLTLTKAKQRAIEYLSQIANDLELYDEPIHEGDYGWVFSYQSKIYLNSNDMDDALCGNAPLLVDKHSSILYILGTAQPVEYYVENYLKFGDPFKVFGSRIALIGWIKGANKVEAIRAIRNNTDFGLNETKNIVDMCLSGVSQEIDCSSVFDASQLALELRKLNFQAKQLGD